MTVSGRPSSQVARLMRGVVTYRVTITPFNDNAYVYQDGRNSVVPGDPGITTINEMDGMLACLGQFLEKAKDERQKAFEVMRAEEDKRHGLA